MASEGLINIGAQTSFAHHRSGWGFALEALQAENSPRGIAFYGFLDFTFSTALNPDYRTMLPLQQPWTGFFHNPQDMPFWHPSEHRLSDVLARDKFRQSLPHCLGLFTLSEHLAAYLRAALKLPVSALFHPTEIPPVTFSYEAFLANREKRIVTVGWWLRRAMSIFYLPLDARSPYRKARLQTGNALIETTHRAISRLEFVNEWRNRKLDQRFRDNTEELAYLPNDAFDRLLSENLVYLDFYAASANNAVVECIARGTPLLVNPLPAVVEYLGPDYPFYFNSLEEAAAKALDFDLVRRTHAYLMSCPVRVRLSQQAFLSDFRASEVYRHLEAARR